MNKQIIKDQIEEICDEFHDGFVVHGNNEEHVAIFGSARIPNDNEYYQLVVELSKAIGELGIPIMTGGGPGIMEAGNLGVKAGEGLSLASSIILPHEQKENIHVDLSSLHNHFVSRKWFLMNNACGYVGAAGGFGTADEVFEVLCLIQTKKIKRLPVVLLGTEFWEPAIEWFKKSMLPMGLIAKSDLELFLVTDDVSEAVNHLIGKSCDHE